MLKVNNMDLRKVHDLVNCPITIFNLTNNVFKVFCVSVHQTNFEAQPGYVVIE